MILILSFIRICHVQILCKILTAFTPLITQTIEKLGKRYYLHFRDEVSET